MSITLKYTESINIKESIENKIKNNNKNPLIISLIMTIRLVKHFSKFISCLYKPFVK